MNNFYSNNNGSSKVMADLFMALTVILISTSVILPNKLPLLDEKPPKETQWQHLHKTTDKTCLNEQCFNSTEEALALAKTDDYLLISISKTTSSEHLFELVQYAQQSNFSHIFIEQE